MLILRWSAVALMTVGACASQPAPEHVGSTSSPANSPAPKVLFARVERADVPIYLERVASLKAYVDAEIRARQRGYLRSQHYEEGSVVQAEQLLFTIESAEYKSTVESARASLTRAVARADLQRAKLERERGLFDMGALARQALDEALSNSVDAQAQVAQARAAVDQAELALSYTNVRSPISGMTSIAVVRIGNLVGQDGPTLLSLVSQIDPMRVYFSLSEQEFVASRERLAELSTHGSDRVKQRLQRAAQRQDDGDADARVDLVLSDGSVYPYAGIVVANAPQFTASTGTIELQALVPNPHGHLHPGQYGRVRMRQGHAGDNVLVVPDKAVISVQGTYALALLTPDDAVQLRRVELGPSVQGLRVVEAGASEGDRVVVEGTQKVSDGMRVRAQPAPRAAASVAPGISPPSSPARDGDHSRPFARN